MKILHVITSLRSGGAEKLLVDLLPRLRAFGNDVEILVFDGEYTYFYTLLEEKKIKINYLRKGGSVYDIRNIFAIIPYLNRFDIIHTHNTACQFYVAIAKKLSASKCLIVTTEHSTSNRRRKLLLFKGLDSWMYHQYKKLICVSNISAQNIKDYIGDDNLPTISIPNGIDYSLFNNAFPEKELVENYSHVCRAVMVAGFRYEKDHPTVIKAFASLSKEFHLFLVGDGVRRAEFEQMCENLNCLDRVHFLGVRSDVPALLKAADIVIMSSHREGLSLSNLEGMASGRPFVASDVEGLHEIVNGYGILFPHEDSKSLSDLIIRLSEDKKYADSIAEKCMLRAKQFDISVMAEKYMDVYRQIIGED